MDLRRLRALAALALLGAAAAQAQPFPRLMGMNIGAKNYQEADYQEALARLDVVILGFYRGWRPQAWALDSQGAMRHVVRSIKARNPEILVGQYTLLNEAQGDPRDAATMDLRDKLSTEKWWLRNARGRRVQWTAQYGTWEINFTPWAAPDSKGRRWPEWLAERNHAVFFRDVPQFDIVYLDNVLNPPRVKGDWDGDGANDDPRDAKVLSAYFKGHLAYWRRLRELLPEALLVGNVDHDLSNPEWRDALDGAFLEGLMGERWSIETWGGWDKMMQRYRAVLKNTRPPHLVGFGVHGASRDYRFFRYAYGSCLLDDGYFSFTDRARGHSGVPWFDEYEHELGKALDKPPAAPWRDGVWRRNFEHGVVLVNPTRLVRTVELEPGLRRLKGEQDPEVNSGAAAPRVTLRPKDGIVLRR